MHSCAKLVSPPKRDRQLFRRRAHVLPAFDFSIANTALARGRFSVSYWGQCENNSPEIPVFLQHD